ncbi:glycosyltransferase family 1 protein [Paenarthrobacter sp. NCHU4564]|uniref:glycosyltransferase family 1 protein n=1 Tax=Paenarthrobacter sp. NCHU4564 TaxID=3451353 RepID=UPI003F9685D7
MNVLHRVMAHAQRDGWPAVTRKIIHKAAGKTLERLSVNEPDLPVRTEDLQASANNAPHRQPHPVSGAMNVGWVCTPPGPGSGGHTTFFRMVQGMEERGHRCALFLYDRNSDDVSRHAAVIRKHWPLMEAEIRSVAEGFHGMDAIVASSWPTAYAAAAHGSRHLHSFYFIQDYEPYFYPRGTLYALAENSYRLGFTNIALGGMIGAVMKSELGMEPAASVPFACDTRTYRLLEGPEGAPTRHGVVYYAKRAVDRRGYLLAKLALEQFHAMHPDQEIHIYGDSITGWSIPVHNHGNLPPGDLNRLYNSTVAGLALSFTNISLVPEELLAAGNVPVLNESAFAAQVLKDPEVIWAPATPSGLAGALARAVEANDIQDRASRIAARRRLDWRVSTDAFAEVLESACSGNTILPGSP